ncbi:MAG: hypothetical protein EA424_10470 [Planctomycetaceae bacterium]|nr:MAG: hypothetical protein EA424_10470 [Planctomycetaceae bacterium]
MSEDHGLVTVVIRDGQACRLGASLDTDTALTLIAVASEDPSCWEDLVGYWPRYRTPVVCEFFDSLPMVAADPEAAWGAISESDAWVLIDLGGKRIVTGGDFQPVGRDAAFAMVVDEDDRQHCPLSVHLPPWWELHEQADTAVFGQPRLAPIRRPEVNREVLFGEPLLAGLASRVLEIVRSERWASRDVDSQRSHYPFTIEVHRDWLMTPREDLGGLMPRQMLHGAHQWIDGLVWAQRLRFEDGGEIIAAPDEVAGYETAPMGGEEMVIYFDLCRELISASWSWCEDEETKRRIAAGENCQPALVGFLSGVKADWLASPFEGGSPPGFIIECSRRRVPRGSDVPIVGMSEREVEQHVDDCDCPICEMMAEGMFGVGFTSLDGHHLELDEEFAFSMHETREAWEQQQREFEEMSMAIDCRQAESEAVGENEPDEFASVWSGVASDEPLPGDTRGHLKLAFLLAEIVSALVSRDASREDIRRLNALFADFRTCDAAERAPSGRRLGDQLDALAERYPELIPRVADFRSRIDECVRSPMAEDDLE